MSKVEIISSCLVGRASNVSIPKSRFELTPLDLRLLLLNYIQTGVLFHRPQSQSFIDHLKSSLSRALDLFPPLAGRLATIQNDDDNTVSFFVDCNNAGAEFVRAVTRDVSVSDIMEPKYVPEEIVSSFFRLNGAVNLEGTCKPLLGVQVTEFVDGLFIAMTANHSVVDGKSFWRFFNLWSEISRGLDSTISKSQVFERTNGNGRIPLPLLEQKQMWHEYVPPRLLMRVFEFSKESLAKLKAKANSEADTDKISTLQALSAHLWLSLTRFHQDKQILDDQSNKEAGFMMAIGARGRIPHLPDGYFGNAVYPARTAVNEAELLQKGLGYAALKISDLVAQQTNESAIKFVEDWLKNPVLVLPVNSRVFKFFITGSPRHDVYGNDFGWGKPIGLRTVGGTRFDGNMATFPSAVAGGIEVHVCLTPEVMQAMEADADFMEAFTL